MFSYFSACLDALFDLICLPGWFTWGSCFVLRCPVGSCWLVGGTGLICWVDG